MSGSFNRPAMPRRPPPQVPAPAAPEQDYADFYDDEPARTAPPRGPSAPAERELYAPARNDGPTVEPGRTPIVPAGSVTGRSLTLVISIMCFLACLTAGAVYMINESAAAWLREIASEVTVQIEPRERVDIEKTISEVATYLGRQPGIVGVKPMSAADSAALLEPWLGQSDALKSLPIPRLIALEVDRAQPPVGGAHRG